MDKRLQSLTVNETETQILLKNFPNGIVAFDLEMTGLSPVFDKIIEIAAIKIDKDANVTTFHEMVNPLVTIPPHTIEYHGITNEMVRNCPSLKLPLNRFKEFYGNLPLIAHNAQFDLGFIVKGHHEYNFSLSLSDVYDSCKFARTVYKKKEIKPDNFKLSTLANYFGIEFHHHQALDDAFASLKIFARILQEYESFNTKRSLKDIAYVFKLNAFKKAEDYILPRKLLPIREKLHDKSTIYIKYKGSSTGENFRPVKPIAIIPMPQGLLLYGECQIDSMNKYFQIKKIKDLKLT